MHTLCGRNRRKTRHSPTAFFLSILLLILAACSGSNSSTPTPGVSPAPASSQVLTFPNVGTQDVATMDPAQGPDANSAVAVGMVYTGLVKFDKNLNVVPDQATWSISSDRKTYTFSLKQGITFSDGTPVTAQSYVYTLTRALLPETKSPIATFFLGNIVGANDLANGKTRTLTGVKALNDTTLQITLTQPTEYFLDIMANSIAFPLNSKLIKQYGNTDWANHVAGNGVGTGPFMVKEWDHNVKMILVPNPHWYGGKTRLREVDMLFVNDPSTAFKAYEAGEYDFVWNIGAQDLQTAKGMPGYTNKSLLQTDLLFFDNTKPPFNNVAMRQAFAYAIDKQTLVTAVFKGGAIAAPTIIPPGMPGYQANYPGLPYDKNKARQLLQSVYPDVSKVPSITFSYPNSQVSPLEAQVLQQMWQNALGIQVKLNAVELNAYNQETQSRPPIIQFGFTQWTADYPDPYDWLTLNLTTNASNNDGLWSNTQFDNTVKQAEQTSGQERIQLYNKAEQIAITNVGWLPLDHEAMAAVIPTYVQGVSLNNTGLYFGDWSGVYLLQH
ncbi:MAG TPA: peptide ABC transporter substrate-binding protein [Ktedonobacteraceae bacterium]|jgi:ABC-type oligopeptide transport system substrate-binding subunit|nr:peptide ABC transporter substrate-binding protein [Ktedonobacteraceae bacterium]